MTLVADTEKTPAKASEAKAKVVDTTAASTSDAPADASVSGGVNTPTGTDATDGDKKDADADESKDESKDEAKDGEEKPKKPLAPKGSIASPMNIYRSPKDDDGEWTWVDKCPEDVPEAAENEETEQYAVVVRNIKSKNSRKKLEAHSIVIQSPHLRAALGEILEGYTGVTCELEQLEFEAPFAPFVHRWNEFIAYAGRADLEEVAREHLKVLRDILDYEIGDLIRAFEDYMRNGVIKFDHLWMIFQPGAVVVSALRGPLSAFELEETEYMQNRCGKFLRLRVDCVDTSGKRFGRSQDHIDIPEFLGVKPITGLNGFPLAFHEDKEAVTASLVARGRIFEQLAGHHFKQYNGTAITWDSDGNEQPIYVTGRIVVDIKSFNRYSPYPIRHVGDWKPHDFERLSEHKLKNGGTKEGCLCLTPYYQMLARSRTRGYSLKLKKWLDFFVQQVSEIDFNTDAFDRLVLPEDQKELILAFSESQLDEEGKRRDPDDGGDDDEDGGIARAGDMSAAATNATGFDDVISGKGRGVICLLSGPPGVGKTLTAEAVAENLRVPLHTLSSGDLGSSPWEVEHGLGRILELVARWNAILLLDECDVFLEARSAHDLERNKVVSIFLRTLEYYEGILFMTTNRVANIDPAFQSRIHVSLEYPDLNAESRGAIWRNFLGVAAGKKTASELSERDVVELAELPLNGRQIKNVIKTSQLLASRKKSPLKRSFIDTVLAIEKRRPVPVAVAEGQ